MSLVVKKLPLAEEDAFDASVWYEARQTGLGDAFLDEVEAAVQALAHEALLHRIRFSDVRRAPVRRFKFYGIYYLVRAEEVLVLAIFHGRRHPRQLQERISQIRQPLI